MKALPPTVIEMVEQLDESFPHRAPDPNDSEREIWMKAGERRLIDGLLMRLRYTEQNALKDSLNV